MALLKNHLTLIFGATNLLLLSCVRCQIKMFSASETANNNSKFCPITDSKLPVYLPYTEDCSSFLICDRGIPYLKSCPLGLHFNRNLKACDYPESAGCDKSIVQEPKERMINDLGPCPAVNPKYPVILPHLQDCSKFYICDSGSVHLKECQSGLHFNPSIKTCDYPTNAKCNTGNTKVPKGKMVGDGSNLCPEGNSKYPVLTPHPDDCSKFYICDGGSAHLKECHPGLHFNPKVKACDYPEKAGCEKALKELPKGRKTDDLDLCPAQNSKYPLLLPHSDDCSKFYICDSGLAHLKECHLGLHFNRKINACDYPEKAGCDKGMRVTLSGVPSPFCPSVNGKFPIFFRHSTNCSVYYMCGNGLAYEFVCPSGLYFSIRKQVCDYEWNSGCRNSNQ